jgi:hypothetical protein
MKKLLVSVFALILLSCTGVLALGGCYINATLVNQDPYPATPGDYVDVVFQLDGVEDPDCKGASFRVIPEYPFFLDIGDDGIRVLPSSTFIYNQKTAWMIPYRLRIDEDALDGFNEVKVGYSPGYFPETSFYEGNFDINIEDVIVDFEVSIKDYDSLTNELTLEILNTGENDVEALTIEIPEQDNIVVKKTSRNIVGSLDSNEDTTFDFIAIPQEGEIQLQILYTDEINVRRSLTKTTYFDPAYFPIEKGRLSSLTISLIVTIVLLISLIVIWRKYKKKKRKF